MQRAPFIHGLYNSHSFTSERYSRDNFFHLFCWIKWKKKYKNVKNAVCAIWAKCIAIFECLFSLTKLLFYLLLSQRGPSKPSLHLQRKEPGVFSQVALFIQRLNSHSFTSAGYRNIIVVFICEVQNLLKQTFEELARCFNCFRVSLYKYDYVHIRVNIRKVNLYTQMSQNAPQSTVDVQIKE